ncbi:MAG: sensor histidine kinase [Aquabacterium sp.]
MPMPTRAFALVWAIFWLLLATISVQDHLRQGHAELWRPLLAEGSSALVASVLMALLWRHVPRLDHRLATPWRWLRLPLAAMLPGALGFVLTVQALRFGAYACIGQPYAHDPWPVLLAYELAKFCIFYLLFVAVLFGLRSHAAMQAERERTLAQQALAREAQLRQLAQQIEPHFLFNALNTIAGTVHASPDLADDLITRLASLLRASMAATQRPLVPLAEELELARAYAAVMQARFGDRVRVAFEIDPATLACAVPVLLLQPLLENAFRHGIEQQAGPAQVEVRARLEGHRLRLAVRADVGRLDPAASDGVGLGNLRQRLQLAHGDAATLRLQALVPAGTVALVELPCAC